MRGPGLLDHTDCKSKKKGPQMSSFPLKLSVKRKKNVFDVRDEASHFLRGPKASACLAHT